MISRRALSALLAGATLPVSPAAHAAPGEASAWSESSHSAVRLLAGGRAQGGPPGVFHAALEFRLAPGFKTYWRDPGDSGVPPVFDWTGSRNVADVEVRWPAPHRFEDAGGSSIGYYGPLLLPLVAKAADPAAPVMLALRIDYAICDKICIPAQGSAQLALRDASGGQASRIADAWRKVPARIEAGEASPFAGLAIRGVSLLDGPTPALAVDAAMPRAAAAGDLFVEGPKGSFFGKPAVEYPAEQPRSGHLVRRRFIAPIEQMAKDAPRWPLTLTLVAGDHAIEIASEIAAPRR
jgi:suppressor for copper-sensitivity B